MVTPGLKQASGRDNWLLPSERTAESRDSIRTRFPVVVLYTTVPATLAALRKAAALASNLDAEIQILAPVVVPYPLPLERPPVLPQFKVREFRTKCEAESIPTRINVQLCRNACECILHQLSPQSVVLIGTDSHWPFHPAQRLARALRRRGSYQILCVHSAEK